MLDTSSTIARAIRHLPNLVPQRIAGFATWCLVASWVTGTYSHVDRLWSITPAVYASVYAYASGFDARASTMAALTWAWGIRLTYNFARKGGYSKGEQDYRWPVLREHPLLKHPVAWQAFNLGFIATYQHALLLLIARPSSAAYEAKGSELNALDRIAIALFAFFVAFESLADQQQWIFQQSKHRAPGHARVNALRDDYKRGFLTSGLFRYSRHPNFFAEQCVWASYYLFAVAAKWDGRADLFGASWRDAWVHEQGVGAVLLVLLFQGSTRFTESITAGKYPEYAEYRKTTSALVPLPPFGKLRAPTKKAR